MDLLPVGVVLVTGEDVATAVTRECNAAYAHMVGATPPRGASLASLPYAYYAADRRERLPTSGWPALRAIATGEAVLDQELHLRRASGEWRVVLASAAPVRQDGRVRGAVVVCRDITGQKQLERALQQSEERSRRWLDALPSLAWRCDATGAWLECNSRWLTYTGQSPEEVRGEGWMRALHPDDRERVAKVVREAGSTELCQSECRLRRASDGAYRWHLASTLPVKDLDGHVTAWFGTATDIEEQRRGQDALRASEDRFRRLVESSIFGLTMGDSTGRLTYVNDALLRTLGCTREEVEAGSLRWDTITPPEYLPLDERANAQIRDHGRCDPYEKEYIAKDGRRVPVLIGVAGIERRDDGRTVAAAYVIDLTPLKKAQDELRASEEQARARAAELEAVLDAVPAAVLIARDTTAQRMDGNRQCLEMFRLAPGSDVSRMAPLGSRPLPFRAMVDGAEVAPDELPVQVAAARGVEVRDREIDLVFEDGVVRHILGNAAPLHDEAGQPRGAVGAFIDITERKRAEAALRAADRKKDEFLAVLSHELRNPLAPIRNSLAILTRVPADAEQASRALAVIDRQVSHLTRLVEDLLDVNRITRGKVQLRLACVELRELVRKGVEDLHTVLAASRLSVTVEIGATPLWVIVDPARIKQALANLLENAAKFTPPGGRVAVAVERTEDGSSARVRVADTGAGIHPEMVPRLFHPFAQADATLARTQGGLGLGLALVKGVVELHGGTVSASSHGPGTGSEFTFRLPLASRPASTGPLVVRAGNGGAGRRVLIIDDNEDFASTLQLVLEMEGHEVHVAFDGVGGLEAARRTRPEVILCDIGLPGMDGYAVARALRGPEVGFSGKLIAVSGYASADDQRLAGEAGFEHHVAKPPALDVLTALLAGDAGDR
ncbi:MAG: PAS domain S-box protein [Anaeromyxobacteraceae bacterium]